MEMLFIFSSAPMSDLGFALFALVLFALIAIFIAIAIFAVIGYVWGSIAILVDKIKGRS